MQLIEIPEADKRRYMKLLLLADEQEDMVERYLSRGEMFALADGASVCAEAVVTREGADVWEIKNIAVAPAYQRKGCGRALIAQIEARYGGRGGTLRVGTGDVPSTVGFYEACGFRRFGVIPDFFTKHYDHPIVEDGRTLRDMVLLQKPLAGGEKIP